MATDLPSGFWPHALPQSVSHDLVLQQMVSLQVSPCTAGPHLITCGFGSWRCSRWSPCR